jgi:beta-lactamase regulating signal transducer with metallopeptidase domain
VPPAAVRDAPVSEAPNRTVLPGQTPTPSRQTVPAEVLPQVEVPPVTAEVAPLVLLSYAGVAALLLAQIGLGHAGLRRLVRSASPAPARVQAVFDDLAAGFRRPPRLFVSDRVTTPVCFGLLRPTVLLPRALAVAATSAELRWVFAHELDHARRGDPATGLFVGLARCLFFFVPWFWPLRRDLSLAQEYLADAAAAAADGRPVDYAAFLVNLSGGPSRVPFGANGVRAGRSDLFRRVDMLLKTGSLARESARGWAVVAAGGLLSVAVLLSGVGWASADDNKPKADKGDKVEKKVIVVGPDGKVEEKEVVVIDGVVVKGEKGEKKVEAK